MTINSATRKAGPFLGNGVTTIFPFAFKIFSTSDVQVTLTDASGVETILNLDSDYIVAANINQAVSPGGNVVYPKDGSPMPEGRKLTVTGDLPALQPTSIPNNGPFFPRVIEDGFDRAVILIQQLKEELSRAVKISVSDTAMAPLPTATVRANTVIGFDAAGNLVVIPVPPSIGAGDMQVDVFVAGVDFVPGTTKQLTLSRPPGTPDNAEVFFDAAFQGPDQWIVAGSAMSFNDPIPIGVSKVFVRIGTTLSTQIPPDHSVGDAQMQWGAALSRTVDSIHDLKALPRVIYKRAIVLGYYTPDDGGGGSYWLDDADTTSADNGGTVIVGSDGGRWKLANTISMSVKQWGAKGDGTSNDTATLTRAAAWVAAKGAAGQSPSLIFPAGIYLYSTSPNWAAWNARIVPLGEVRLRCNGTGHSVIINGEGATNGRVYNMEFGPFIVEGESTTLDGVWVKQADHCRIKVNVRGAGATAAALRTLWCVASEFHFISSGNENPAAIGFYNNNTPLVGLALDGVGGSQTAYCTFYNPICERMPLGAVLGDALGNVFLGGALEGCTSTGVQLSAGAIQNKFFGTDFEANTTYDVNCAGDGNEFHGCDTEKLIVFTSGAIRNKVVSGQHGDISLQAGANQNLVSGATYNRFASGASITDGGANNRFRDNLNVGLGVYENVKSARVGIPVGASPFTYTNTSGNDQTVLITGGTVSAMAIVRGANPGDSFTGGMVTLSPGDAVQVTYSSAPSMFSYTR